MKWSLVGRRFACPTLRCALVVVGLARLFLFVTSAALADDVPDLAQRGQGSDWPRFLGPSGDNKSTETGIVTDWGKTGPTIVWQTRLGTSYGPPAVAKGRLFHFDRYVNAATLTCRNAETGEQLWKVAYTTDYKDMYGYNNGPRAAPVVDEERVYTFGAEGMLYCRRVTDGEELWSVDTAQKFGVIQNFFGASSVPWVEGELLIVMVGGSPMEEQRIPPGRLDLVRGNGSGIVAFDKRTGEIRYQITDELASYASPYVATIRGRRWGLAFARGGLVAFEPTTGKVEFQFPWRAKILESVNASNPVVARDQVLISETYGPGSALLRVKPGAYEVVWSDEKRGRNKAMQTHWNTPIHVDGYVYGSSGRHKENAELRCIELATGKVQWSIPSLTRSSLMYVDGHFICLTETGELILFKANPKEYEELAKIRPTQSASVPGEAKSRRPLLAEPAWAAPILARGLLYLRGDDRLVCMELIPQR